MSSRLRAQSVAACVALLLPLAVRAADPTPAPTAATAATAPPAIPLPEIANRSDDTAVYLHQLEERLAPGPEIQQIETELPVLSERMRLLRARIDTILAASPPLRDVDDLLGQLQGGQDTVSAWANVVTARATVLEQELQGLTDLRALWKVTRDEAQAAGAPPAVLDRIKSTATLLQQVRKRIEGYRETLLVLQDRMVQELAHARETVGQLDAYRREAVGRLLIPDGEVIWSPQRWSSSWNDSGAQLRSHLADGWTMTSEYLRLQLSRVPLQLALFGALLALWRRARQRTAGWLQEDTTLAPVAAVFEHPVSSALFLTLLSSAWIYPQPPLVMRYLVRIAAVPPVLRVLDRLVDAALLPGFYALGACFVADQLRNMVTGVGLVEQIIFLLEMLAGALVTWWMLRSGRLRRLDPPPSPRTTAVLERGVQVLAGLFGVAFLAAALGFMQLARMIAGAVLGSGYAAMLLFALARLAEGLWAFLLRTRTLRRARMVELNRALLQRRGERFINWVAMLLWFVAMLDSAGLLSAARETLGGILTATLTIGAFSIALRDVLAFALTVWLSFLLSRFARFVLEEDVYPRVRLPRGLPYALSNMLHYTVLLIGFLIALAASGLNLDRFALLAGAFGLGIGFGLQNVVNNFVSGLILLFERPIQVGDTVQVGSVSGEVRHIGIRSSTLRTGDGAEVIVPNGNLIADTVTNWTLSDRMRRIDIGIGAAYGSDPERVLELLRGVATAHALVLDHPPPTALFTEFGDNALTFELRCWTDRFDQWSAIRSELAVALNKAFNEAGIGIPFPQRDINFNLSTPLPVRVVQGESK